jgi:hypothetical protein
MRTHVDIFHEVLKSSRFPSPRWSSSQGPSSQSGNFVELRGLPHVQVGLHRAFSLTASLHLCCQVSSQNVASHSFPKYNLDGHTTNVVGVILQDYKAHSVLLV